MLHHISFMKRIKVSSESCRELQPPRLTPRIVLGAPREKKRNGLIRRDRFLYTVVVTKSCRLASERRIHGDFLAGAGVCEVRLACGHRRAARGGIVIESMQAKL